MLSLRAKKRVRAVFAALGIGALAASAARAEVVSDPASVRGGLVVSVDPVASRIGAEVLERGGNAVDAAVATALALAVTFPEAGNLGGGGFMLVREASSGAAYTVDYRERAPRLATPDMFLGTDGRIDRRAASVGWLVVGVPGTPMGLWTAHRRGGRLAWRDLVAPAIKLAEEGFVVTAILAEGLESQQEDFTSFREPARVYFDNGKPPAAGSTLRLPDFARTLRRIAEHGAPGFYVGPTAELVELAMIAEGGLVRRDDLAGYEAVIREPVRGHYRGHEIVSMGPPSSGGVALIQMLGILEGFNLAESGPGQPRTLHLLAEAMKRAFCDRARFLGDTDFVPVPLERLLSTEHAARWRSTIGPRATPAAAIGQGLLTGTEANETTHFSVIDAAGNIVSNTYTLEGRFGAKVIAPGTGFLLNNEMHDFNIRPGQTDETGLIGTEPNLIAPGKRMLSSQTPTLVLHDGKPLLVLGSPGGRTIINTVLAVLSNVIDHRMTIQEAIDAPRVHHQWEPDEIVVEPGIPVATRAALEAMGHVVRVGPAQGDCHAILIDPATGEFIPGADRRRQGGAAGIVARPER